MQPPLLPLERYITSALNTNVTNNDKLQLQLVRTFPPLVFITVFQLSTYRPLHFISVLKLSLDWLVLSDPVVLFVSKLLLPETQTRLNKPESSSMNSPVECLPPPGDICLLGMFNLSPLVFKSMSGFICVQIPASSSCYHPCFKSHWNKRHAGSFPPWSITSLFWYWCQYLSQLLVWRMTINSGAVRTINKEIKWSLVAARPQTMSIRPSHSMTTRPESRTFPAQVKDFLLNNSCWNL